MLGQNVSLKYLTKPKYTLNILTNLQIIILKIFRDFIFALKHETTWQERVWSLRQSLSRTATSNSILSRDSSGEAAARCSPHCCTASTATCSCMRIFWESRRSASSMRSNSCCFPIRPSRFWRHSSSNLWLIIYHEHFTIIPYASSHTSI